MTLVIKNHPITHIDCVPDERSVSADKNISQLEIDTAVDVIYKVIEKFKNTKNKDMKSIDTMYKNVGYFYLSKNDYISSVKFLTWSSKLGNTESTFVLSQLDIVINECKLINKQRNNLQNLSDVNLEKLHMDYFEIRNNPPPVPIQQTPQTQYTQMNHDCSKVVDNCLDVMDLTDDDITDIINEINNNVQNKKNMVTKRKINLPSWVQG